MSSADSCAAIRGDLSPLSPFGHFAGLPGKIYHLPHVDAGFIKHTPIADGGLHGHVPTGPECTTPHIRFLFVAPRFRIGLPSDLASQRRPCPSPCLRLRLHLARGLSPRKRYIMPGTHAQHQQHIKWRTVCLANAVTRRCVRFPGRSSRLPGRSPHRSVREELPHTVPRF